MFRPDPALARELTDGIERRLATSLDELTRACRGVVTIDEAMIRSRFAALRGTDPIRPAVFLLYFECLLAARRDDPDTLARHLRTMSEIPLQGSSFAVRNFGDVSLPAVEWQRYRRVLLDEPQASVAVEAVPPWLFAAASSRLALARAAIEVADPALAGEIGVLIHEVVFAQDQGQDQDPDQDQDRGRPNAGFGGATSYKAWGATFLNARRHPSLVSMAGGLVHEAAHALLFAHSSGEPLVENDGGELYPSPLRTDKRPMDGIVHATFVSARMAYAMDRMLASEALDPAQRQEAECAANSACRAFDAGYAVVFEHARPTATGRRAMDEAAAYRLYRRSVRDGASSTPVGPDATGP